MIDACNDCFISSSQFVFLFFFLPRPFVAGVEVVADVVVFALLLLLSCCVLKTSATSTSSWLPKLFQFLLLVRSSIALAEGLVPAVKPTLGVLPVLVVADGLDFKVANMDSKKAPPDEDERVDKAGGFNDDVVVVSAPVAAATADELMELKEFNSFETTLLNISCRRISVTESVDANRERILRAAFLSSSSLFCVAMLFLSC